MVTRYRTIVADPPWEYETMPKGRAGWRQSTEIGGLGEHVMVPYPTLSVQEIAALPVGDLADPVGAWLFLWTTNRYLPASFDVAAAWGFTYRQTIVWAKPSFPVGGSVTPNAAEYLLVCRRGRISLAGKWPGGSVITAPKGATAGSHSTKPDVFLDMIEHVAPGPYLEMFARRARFGWDYWGDQSLGTAEVAA